MRREARARPVIERGQGRYDMCWDAAASYPADPRTPALARRFCGENVHTVLGHSPPVTDLVDDLAVVTSELVTNAVNVSSGTIGVSLEIHRFHVQVAVTDDAPGEPRIRHPDSDEDGGRGLAITAQLSRAWGVDALRSGKRVWAEVSIDQALTGELQCSRTA